MSQEALTIPLSSIRYALSQLPKSKRGEMALALFGMEEDQQVDHVTASSEFWSYEITNEQARALVSKLDKLTKEMLREMIKNERDGVATIDWSDIKRITGVENWSQFARGRLGGLHRSLVNLPDVPRGARLITEGDGWVEDGKGDYSAGTLVIDGPAVQILRTVLNVPGDSAEAE